MTLPMRAYIAATQRGGVPYGSLKPGDRFTFPDNPARVLTKRKGGWYESETGKKYRTGSCTAVISYPRSHDEGTEDPGQEASQS